MNKFYLILDYCLNPVCNELTNIVHISPAPDQPHVESTWHQRASQVLLIDLLVDGTSSSKWVGEPDYRGPGWLEEQGTSGREAICGLSICLTADCSGTQLMDVHVGAV